MEDTGRSAVTAAKLDDAMISLVSACPALTSFNFHGHLSTAILRVLGARCPLLTTLTYIGPRQADHAYLKQILLLQPSILPHISSLTFQDCKEEFYNLPDMTGNISITSLRLDKFIFESDAEWLRESASSPTQTAAPQVFLHERRAAYLHRWKFLACKHAHSGT